MDYKQMTAPCGLDCFNCPMYLANENEELRTAISKNMGIPYEKAFCVGYKVKWLLMESWDTFPEGVLV